MSARRAPRIVAELGRPETPEETAARLAESSRNYRQRKTVNNLILSLLATLGAVLVLVLLVPRNDAAAERDVDYRAVAAQAQPGQAEHLAAPALPEGWRANAAQWRPGGSDQVSSWYIGLLTPENRFIGLTQAMDVNPTWLADRLDREPASGTATIGGLTWDVYRSSRPEGDQGNFAYALVTTSEASTYLLVGTAGENEFEVLADAVAADMKKGGTQ